VHPTAEHFKEEHMLAARKRLLGAAGALAFAALLAGCTTGGGGNTGPTNNTGNDETGDQITIGFSGPAADHGWLGAINSGAIAEAAKYPDIELVVAEGTNDANLQISQVETFINDGVDAIVLLPTDGAALTEVAIQAMEAGIPVINVDREFSSPCKADAIVAEVAGIDSLPLTQDRSRGFKDALADCGLEVNNRVAADFTVAGGEAVTSQLLAAAPHIDALWNHDDDQGVGVLSAIDAAGRDEFFMVGGAGSKNAMDLIKSGDSILEATIIYPSTQAADGIRLARLLAQNKSLADLVEVEVPNRIVLSAPVVTAENVDKYLPTAFAS
jgi:ribose transport system substrate-binding protein